MINFLTNKELQIAINSLLECLTEKTQLTSYAKDEIIYPVLRKLLDEQLRRANDRN